jgi:hypothetical protein
MSEGIRNKKFIRNSNISTHIEMDSCSQIIREKVKKYSSKHAQKIFGSASVIQFKFLRIFMSKSSFRDSETNFTRLFHARQEVFRMNTVSDGEIFC